MNIKDSSKFGIYIVTTILMVALLLIFSNTFGFNDKDSSHIYEYTLIDSDASVMTELDGSRYALHFELCRIFKTDRDIECLKEKLELTENELIQSRDYNLDGMFGCNLSYENSNQRSYECPYNYVNPNFRKGEVITITQKIL